MNIVTKLFGDIQVDAKKIINFKDGIIGYGQLKQFMLIHDLEDEKAKIVWLQSLDEPSFALPVIDPLIIKDDYNPTVEDELFKNIGDIEEDQIMVLTTLTVPSDISKITTNLKAPIIINPITMKGCQIIVDNDEYPIKYEIYDVLKNNSKKDGE